MHSTFFAIRPMLSGNERKLIANKAFLAKISVSYLSRKRSPFREVSLYNVFSLKTSSLNLGVVQKFMNQHAFFPIACFFDGYILDIATIRQVSLLSQDSYAFLSLRLVTAPFLSLLLKILFLSIFTKKCLQLIN